MIHRSLRNNLFFFLMAIVGWDVAGPILSIVTAQEAQQAQETNRTLRLPGIQPSGSVLLPNGWSIRAAGTQVSVGDFPVHMEVTPDKKFLAVLHAGYGEHELIFLELATQRMVSRTILPQVYYGFDFSADGKQILISGAEYESLHLLDYESGAATNLRSQQLLPKEKTFVPCGIKSLAAPNQWLVCGVLGHQLARWDSVQQKADFLSLPENSYPYAVCVSPDGKTAWVSLWAQRAVAEVDLEAWKVVRTLETRSHPCEMAILDAGRWLLVACADDNSVVLLDLESGLQKEVLQTALYAQAKNGSTPSSIAVSEDGNSLLAANADNNNLAIFDIRERGKSKSLGFIPAGWYPTSVRFGPGGERILVANGKGLASKANPQGPRPGQKELPPSVRQYIAGLYQGTIGFLPTPTPQQMAVHTRQAFANSPLQEKSAVRTQTRTEGNPIPAKVGDPSPIKHCFYIVKENRTYDQVFGDMPVGNGDPNLCLFPEAVTPNHHRLASDFVLLDNCYVESEVSADGHEWSMAAYATDYVERSWPLSYRKGLDKFGYPSEGKRQIAFPSSGYIWDACKKAGVDYFSFGEFVDNAVVAGEPATTKVEALRGHFDPLYRSYDLNYRDVRRADRFIERLKQFEQEDNLPGLVIMRLPNDHTSGTKVGAPTPTAMVADNDLALGMVVDAISRSKYWKESAIFVVEDDAQNGADHVDAHRSVALVISPYSRRMGVDSELYSTASILRTMELILGIEPMTQFDAAATPMYGCFQATAELAPYDLQPAQVDVNEVNQPTAWGADLSEQLDLSQEDAADDLLFGDIVWRSVKGADHPMPAPVRAAFVFQHLEEEEEEEEEGEDEEESAEPGRTGTPR
jgi:DNA-binding beta-propeller fold protein YncE